MIYLEQFKIPQVGNIGIEDLEDGRPASDHFMPDLQQHRFHMWWNGGGIGNADTLEEAREFCLGYATRRLKTKIAELRRDLREAEGAQTTMGDDPFNLGQFKGGD